MRVAARVSRPCRLIRSVSDLTPAVVLEEPKDLRIRDIEVREPLGPQDVRIDISRVGICGSDVAYYKTGRIGDFVVTAPMILGHEASGVVSEVGANVQDLQLGDRVCMEPGIPVQPGKATHLGMYNIDPSIRFWATPPFHGCLRPSVVHPAAYTFKVPDHVTLDEAALVEPLAVGMHASVKAACKPGDKALVIGAGPIGIVTALSALASGCSEIIIADIQDAKLSLAEDLGPITGINVEKTSLSDAVLNKTNNWGVDKVFECSGNGGAASQVFDFCAPGGTVVHVGHPREYPIDIVKAQVKEIRIETCFRYAHVYPRCVNLIASGAIDLKPLITHRFSFEQSVPAFEFAAKGAPESVKSIIEVSSAR